MVLRVQHSQSFAGRVAASLLTAIALHELIVQTAERFENLAIELASTPARLAAIRERLTRNRSAAPLFDTGLFARHLKSAYKTMAEHSRAGLSAQAIQVAPLG